MEMDAAAVKTSRGEVPLKLTGRSGELVEQLYFAAGKDAKKFDAFVKQLEVGDEDAARGMGRWRRRLLHPRRPPLAPRLPQGLVKVVERSGLVVDRFFSTANYRCAAGVCARPRPPRNSL
jgi:hypothetical protein